MTLREAGRESCHSRQGFQLIKPAPSSLTPGQPLQVISDGNRGSQHDPTTSTFLYKGHTFPKNCPAKDGLHLNPILSQGTEILHTSHLWQEEHSSHKAHATCLQLTVKAAQFRGRHEAPTTEISVALPVLTQMANSNPFFFCTFLYAFQTPLEMPFHALLAEVLPKLPPGGEHSDHQCKVRSAIKRSPRQHDLYSKRASAT